MIQIKKGGTRIVVITNRLVFKFPSHVYPVHYLTVALKVLRKYQDWRLASRNIGNAVRSFWRGIQANLIEFMVWRECRASFLVPVFTLGVVSIQRYEKGREPLLHELDRLYLKLSPEAREALRRIDPHAHQPTNWRKNEKGLRLIDYAGVPGKHLSFAGFILEFRHELEKACRDT